MNTRTLARTVVTAAEKHGQDTREPDHAFGDLEEAIVACFDQLTAEQFVSVTNTLEATGVPRLGSLVKVCHASPKARLSDILKGAKTCKQCGTPLKGRYCADDSCPFSDWPQRVSLFDLHGMHTFQVEEKYGAKRRTR